MKEGAFQRGYLGLAAPLSFSISPPPPLQQPPTDSVSLDNISVMPFDVSHKKIQFVVGEGDRR